MGAIACGFGAPGARQYIGTMGADRLWRRGNAWDGWLAGRCAVCHAWTAGAVCEECVTLFGQPRNRCRTCAAILPPNLAHCGGCVRQPPPVIGVLAAVDYDYPWAQLVRAFKFHGDIAWARLFARLMRSTPWLEPALEDSDWILPMPLSTQRLRERGFNQSLVLACAVADAQVRKVRHDALLRIRDTLPQSSLPQSERQANVARAFVVHPDHFTALRGKKVILVDDVMTTGASLHAAAQALIRAGTEPVTALVFARTPG